MAAGCAWPSPADPTAAAPAPARFHGFLRERGRTVRFDIPGATTKTIAGGSNNRGQLVGGYTDASGEHGFVWRKGRFVTVDVPGATSTSLTEINDRGELLGARGDATGAHGILLSKGRVTSFDAPGAAITFPFGLNNRGQIVGFAYADPAAPAARGFLLAKGVTGPFTPVDEPGAATTMAFGIDDHGRVVGGYQNPDATPSPQPAATPLGGRPDRWWPTARLGAALDSSVHTN